MNLPSDSMLLPCPMGLGLEVDPLSSRSSKGLLGGSQSTNCCFADLACTAKAHEIVAVTGHVE